MSGNSNGNQRRESPNVTCSISHQWHVVHPAPLSTIGRCNGTSIMSPERTIVIVDMNSQSQLYSGA